MLMLSNGHSVTKSVGLANLRSEERIRISASASVSCIEFSLHPCYPPPSLPLRPKHRIGVAKAASVDFNTRSLVS
jgi:hypothetical protein